MSDEKFDQADRYQKIDPDITLPISLSLKYL